MYVHELFHIHGNSGSEGGVEFQLEGRVEFGSVSGAEFQLKKQSSDLEVGWNLEQQKCEMGYPLTKTPIPLSIEFTALANEDEETKDKKFFLL